MDDEYIAAGPADIRENFRALKEDQIVDAGHLAGLSAGNASGNIPVSNGTINTNLNADLLDGYEANAFASASHAHTAVTTSTDGMMRAVDKTKLDGIATGAQVNQNAFSNVVVGSTTIQADSATDTLELAAGTNISITADATNDRLTINNTYAYAHPTGDGNLHVPATGATNSTKVLKAGPTPGAIAWGQVAAGEVAFAPITGIDATTVAMAIAELEGEKLETAEVVTTAAANKVLRLNENSKLPASITGDADTVNGCHAGNAANNVLKLDVNGQVPTANLPIATNTKIGAVKLTDVSGFTGTYTASKQEVIPTYRQTGIWSASVTSPAQPVAFPVTLDGMDYNGAFYTTGPGWSELGRTNWRSISTNIGDPIPAGTYNLSQLLQLLVDRSHRHMLFGSQGGTIVNCNCNCDGG